LLLKTSYVLKADGLAAGKGVLIIHDLAEAKEELRNMLVHQKLAQPVLK
jgi:phosphoribosylamine--glycine ligase